MSFIYLATPYSKFKKGLDEADRLASFYAAVLIKEKLPVFSPIAHSHAIAKHGKLAGKDHLIWMPLDFAFTESAPSSTASTPLLQPFPNRAHAR